MRLEFLQVIKGKHITFGMTLIQVHGIFLMELNDFVKFSLVMG